MQLRPGNIVKFPSGTEYFRMPSGANMWSRQYGLAGLLNLDTAKILTPTRPDPIGLAGVNAAMSTMPLMGSDPEVFISRLGNFKPEPAFELLPKNVKGPMQPAWFWDGFQAETTIQPENCHVYMARNWNRRLIDLRFRGFQAHSQSYWRVPEGSLREAAEEHVTFGCAPSFNVYGTQGKHISNPRELKYRFAGGHIHFGTVLKEEEVKQVVKGLDAILAIPLVAILEGYDHPIRRKYYGMAGEFRLPAHGLEYRTLSNGPFCHPQLFQLTMDLARYAFNVSRAGYRKAFLGSEALIRQTIDSCDVRTARDLFKFNRPYYEAFHTSAYRNANYSSKFATMEQLVMQGAQTFFPDWKQGMMANWLGDSEYSSKGARQWQQL